LATAIALAATALVVSPASARELNVPLFGQQQSQWCWAASSQMLQHSARGTNNTQCQLVKWGHDKAECADNPGTDAQARRALAAGGVSTRSPDPSLLGLAEIKAETDAGRAFLYHYTYDTKGGGHMVVVTGYTDDHTGVYVHWNDPAPLNVGSTHKDTWARLYGHGNQWTAYSSIRRY
jgi:hypothetical protein